MGTELAGGLIAFFIAFLTTPAGVSGAVFLVPVQVSLLGVANPALTPTNLLYNIIATPGALAGYRRIDWSLARPLLISTVPGIAVGAVLRVFVLDNPDAFFVVIALVLAPVGLSLLTQRPLPLGSPTGLRLGLLGGAVGVVGGIYGIGGGSLLAPLLVGMGLSVALVAPAALATTFAASVVGVVSFAALSALGNEGVAPDWPLGIAMGCGGLLGGFGGARMQPLMSDRFIARTLGVMSLALAARYFVIGTVA